MTHEATTRSDDSRLRVSKGRPGGGQFVAEAELLAMMCVAWMFWWYQNMTGTAADPARGAEERCHAKLADAYTVERGQSRTDQRRRERKLAHLAECGKWGW